MHVDDSACNLASLNLMKFRRADGTLDVESFEHAVDVVLLGAGDHRRPLQLPDRGDRRQRPRLSPARARLREPRRLADGRRRAIRLRRGPGYAAAITALMTGHAYATSAESRAALGPYERYANNRDAQNNVMRKHRDAAYEMRRGARTELIAAAGARGMRRWSWARSNGYRNAQATVLAPTGTISFLMDCDTTGVEPDFSLVKFKELVGGGQMTIVNRTVPLALQTLGYTRAAGRADRGLPRRARHDRGRARPGRGAPARVRRGPSASARSRTWAT